MNKLVRDNIPTIIEASGARCTYRVLNDEEFYKALKVKLEEEVTEFLESDDPSELIDIYEVLLAFLECSDISLDTFLRAAEHKRNGNGAFKNKIFLSSVEDNEVIF